MRTPIESRSAYVLRSRARMIVPRPTEEREPAQTQSTAERPLQGQHFAPDEQETIRRWLTEDALAPMCPRCGTILQVAAWLASGGAILMVWTLHCAVCHRSMLAGPHLQRHPVARNGRRASRADRARARLLPLHYLRLQGGPATRALWLVRGQWPEWPRPSQRDLAQGLVPVFETLEAGADLTTLATACEQIVVRFLEQPRG